MTGTNFLPCSVIQWNGTPRATTYIGPTQISTTILPADLSTVGTANVTVFNPAPGDALTGADVAQACRSLKVDVLLVNARDPAWNSPDSWVWKTKPSIQNDFVRIYRCGSVL